MRTWLCWVLATVVTLVLAVWQRMSGPTHPARGTLVVAGQTLKYTLPRTQITGRPLRVTVPVPEASASGEVAWRRYPTGERWRSVTMRREGEQLLALLPTQPMAGKIEYQVRLRVQGGDVAPFPDRPAVARFRRSVPAWALVPHILAMFTGMLMATRAGLEAVARRPNTWLHTVWACGLLVVGGFVLGPLVQKLAFDAWWTGVPHGWDLTDNKTLIAVPFWVWAVWALRRGRASRTPVIVAALVTLVVFTIPHSVWGSQLDWSKTVEVPADPRQLQ